MMTGNQSIILILLIIIFYRSIEDCSLSVDIYEGWVGWIVRRSIDWQIGESGPAISCMSMTIENLLWNVHMNGILICLYVIMNGIPICDHEWKGNHSLASNLAILWSLSDQSSFNPITARPPYIGILLQIGVPLAAYIQSGLHCVTLSEEYSA